jgi:hypothetical protein
MPEGTSRTVAGMAVRPIVILLVVAQIAVPAVLLVARHLDPDRGQLPFGWQMHTTCWGSDASVCDP